MTIADPPWAEVPDDDFGITITAAGTILTRYCDPAVGGCGHDLSLDRFYAPGTTGLARWTARICAACTDARAKADPRLNRVVDRRARGRASTRLRAEHLERYRRIYAEEYELAMAEALELEALVVGPVRPREPLKLISGSRRGKSLISRIDTASCTRCHTAHDRGHACPSCGWVEPA
jgi:hypothetical protein